MQYNLIINHQSKRVVFLPSPAIAVLKLAQKCNLNRTDLLFGLKEYCKMEKCPLQIAIMVSDLMTNLFEQPEDFDISILEFTEPVDINDANQMSSYTDMIINQGYLSVTDGLIEQVPKPTTNWLELAEEYFRIAYEEPSGITIADLEKFGTKEEGVQ